MIDGDGLSVLDLGSCFLGAGGGEDSSYTKLMAACQIKRQPIIISSPEEIQSDGIVTVLSFLGCPTIEDERISNLLQIQRLLSRIEEIYCRPISAVSTLGIGGRTVFFPLFFAGHFDLPILDADCFGRCFPELQISSTHLAGILPNKAFIANVMGEFFEIECNTFRALERHARRLTNSSSGGCIIVPQVLTGEEAKRGLISGTLTQAMTIGQIIQDTQDLGVEEACSAITQYTKGKFIGVGGVVQTRGVNLPHPFTKHIVIKNAEEDRTWEIWMDNEFNLLFENGALVAEVPDIIALCDVCTREPLTLNQLRLHENVIIFTMPAPEIWYTEKGLALVRTKDHQDGKVTLCGSASSTLKKIA